MAVVAGPCLLESEELAIGVGSRVRDLCAERGLTYIFKASLDKANRSSIRSSRGPGMEKGAEVLARVRDRLGVPATTDIHLPEHAAMVAGACDLIQIPAFLCRQTDLLQAAGEAAAKHGLGVNVKKGQFMSPREMNGCVRKLEESGCANVMLTERGTFFGYHRLVNDFIGLGELMELGEEAGARDSRASGSHAGAPPVCFDVTHSTQLPGAGETTGGKPRFAPLLARAATAAGVHALFIETHPEPARAQSDAATMVPLSEMARLLESVARIRAAMG